jgi:chemotaxis protein MotB
MQSDLDARDKNIDELKTTVEARDRKITDLEQALKAEQARVADLDAKMKALEAAKNAEIAKLQDQMADVLKARTKMKDSIEQMQAALKEMADRKREAETRVAEFHQLLDRFKPLIDTGKLRVRMADGRMVIRLATDVLFQSGRADLSEDGTAAIAEVTQTLVAIPGRRYQIEGHTDNMPIATKQFPSNWELAAARAITVAKTMIGAGLPALNVSAASYGEYKPVATNETTEGRTQNRRIEIVVVPDLSSLPGFDELQQMQGGGTPQAPPPQAPAQAPTP